MKLNALSSQLEAHPAWCAWVHLQGEQSSSPNHVRKPLRSPTNGICPQAWASSSSPLRWPAPWGNICQGEAKVGLCHEQGRALGRNLPITRDTEIAFGSVAWLAPSVVTLFSTCVACLCTRRVWAIPRKMPDLAASIASRASRIKSNLGWRIGAILRLMALLPAKVACGTTGRTYLALGRRMANLAAVEALGRVTRRAVRFLLRTLAAVATAHNSLVLMEGCCKVADGTSSIWVDVVTSQLPPQSVSRLKVLCTLCSKPRIQFCLSLFVILGQCWHIYRSDDATLLCFLGLNTVCAPLLGREAFCSKMSLLSSCENECVRAVLAHSLHIAILQSRRRPWLCLLFGLFRLLLRSASFFLLGRSLWHAEERMRSECARWQARRCRPNIRVQGTNYPSVRR